MKIIGHLALKDLLNAEHDKYNVLHYTNADMGPLTEVKLYAKNWFHKLCEQEAPTFLG